MEKELEDKDVLLIHPGTDRQEYVTGMLPKKFPRLKIGILTYLPGDYRESKGNIAILPITIDDDFSKGIENMIRFILEGQPESGGDDFATVSR